MDLQHPIITQLERKGYVNMVNQPKHAGTDFYGSEVFAGERVILLPNGEMLLEENLEDYLIEELGFHFTLAE